MHVSLLQVQAFLVATLLCVIGTVLFAFGRETPPCRPAGRLEEKINPNAAPVASLVRVPQIGLTRARAVVAYRDDMRGRRGEPSPFHCLDDLQRVSGIGPKTGSQIADCLEFDPPGDI